MNARKYLAGVAALAMGVSMAGCSSSQGSSGGSSDSDNSGGSSSAPLIVGTTQELDGLFSPLYATSAYDQWVVNMVYESMLKYNGENEIVTQAAAEMPTLAEDGNSVTFKLKEGLKFSDGSDLDANDVKFTFTLMADPEYVGEWNDGLFNFIEGWDEYQKGDATEVTGIVVEDPQTITFKFAKEDIDAVNSIGTFGIVSDTLHEYTKGNLGEYKTDLSNPVGSGAYMLNSYEKSSGASFKKNPEFANDGDYKIDRVVIKTIAAATELASLENGDINYLPETIESDIIGPASLNEDLAMDHYFRAAEGYMGFNTADGPTKDVAVRQALSYATDRASFNKAFYAYPEAADDIKDISVGYVPTVFWSPVGEGCGQYTVGDADLEGLTEYNYDIEKAKKILDDAGWKEGSDGIREKDGQKLEIKFLATKDNTVLDTLIPMLLDSWKQIGVDLKQNTVEFGTMTDTVKTTNTDVSGWNVFFMATSFTGLSNTTMNLALGYSDVNGKTVFGANNYSRIMDEDLNTYLEEGKNTTDVEASEAAYKKAMVRESELAPYLPIYGNQLFNIYSKNVKGFETGSVCNWSQALETAYIE